jgi:hypothetical protein
MPMYVIERLMPGVGEMTDDQARKTILDSLEVMDDLGEGIQWFRSFIVDNKVYCIYYAPDESLIRRHAEKLGAPVDRISEVRRMLDPRTIRPETDAAA